MITLIDFAAFHGLEPAEIAAIAEREHSPEVFAGALAYFMEKIIEGRPIPVDIVAAIRAAMVAEDYASAQVLFGRLRQTLAGERDSSRHDTWSQAA